MDPSKFPSRLERARVARGLTQAKLAARADLSDGGAVSRYERGAVAPTAESLTKLGTALDVSLDWLNGAGPDAVPPPAEPEKGAAA